MMIVTNVVVVFHCVNACEKLREKVSSHLIYLVP